MAADRESTRPTMVYMPVWVWLLLKERADCDERSVSWEAARILKDALVHERPDADEF